MIPEIAIMNPAFSDPSGHEFRLKYECPPDPEGTGKFCEQEAHIPSEPTPGKSYFSLNPHLAPLRSLLPLLLRIVQCLSFDPTPRTLKMESYKIIFSNFLPGHIRKLMPRKV